MSDLQPDFNDPTVRAQLGLEERTEGGPADLQGPQGQPQGALKHVRDALEQTTKAKREAEQEAAQLRRELAIERSQLPDFPGKQFFIQNYNGEPTPEAIKAAALAAGFVLDAPAAPAEEAAPAVPAAELAQHRAVAEVAAGSSTGNEIPLEQAILGARSAEEVMKIMAEAAADPKAGVRLAPTVL